MDRGWAINIYEPLESCKEELFQGLGDWRVSGISADGSVVVGSRSNGSDREAVRWSQGVGLVGMGYFSGGNNSIATAASYDGSVIVGSSNSGSTGDQAYRWTYGTGMVLLDALPGEDTSCANDVSSDGTVIVGKSGRRAWSWTVTDGMQEIPDLGTTSYATAVSADGTVIVGASKLDGSLIDQNAFRWTKECGLTILTPDDPGSRALGISADGMTVVGMKGNYDDAFCWTPNEYIVSLVDSIPDDAPSSYANDANGDGSKIVGRGIGAALWDKASMEYTDVQEMLVNDFGLNLTGWYLSDVSAISDDGLTLAGYGSGPGNQTSWIAEIG